VHSRCPSLGQEILSARDAVAEAYGSKKDQKQKSNFDYRQASSVGSKKTRSLRKETREYERNKFALIVMLSDRNRIGSSRCCSVDRVRETMIILSFGQMTTMKQRKDFFRTLTPERKKRAMA